MRTDHVGDSLEAAMAKMSMPRINIWRMGGIMSRQISGWERRDMQGKVGEDIKIVSRQKFATDDNSIGMVGDVNAIRVKVRAVLNAGWRVIEKEDGNETDRGFGNVKSVMESERARFALEGYGADANSIDGEAPKSFDGVGENWMKIFKVQHIGGNVARGATVKNKRQGKNVGRGIGVSGKSGVFGKRVKNSQTSVIRVI
jgi:hypothetical protein